MSRKIPKLSHDHVCVSDELSSGSSNWQNHPQTAFTELPTEILSLIFSYLTPRDIVNLQKLCNGRIINISLNYPYADFTGCNSISEEEVLHFFTKDRARQIKEINFSDIFCVKSRTLETCVIRCKHLRKLYAYDCNFKFHDIISILERCKELEELSWTIWDVEDDTELVIKSKETFHKLKKLYLTVNEEFEYFYLVERQLSPILNQCASSLEVFINFTPIFLSTIPPDTGYRIFVGNHNYCPTYPLISRYRPDNLNDFRILNKAKVQVKVIGVKESSRNDNLAEIFTFHSSYLQLVTEEKELCAIPSFPENSVHTLVLILTEESLCLEKHMQKLKWITGEKLKHLTMHASHDGYSIHLIKDMKLPHNFLREMVSTCVNIQVLNLSELHFDETLPFTSFYCLKNLKILNLPSCSLRSPLISEAAILQEEKFDCFTSHCKNVEKFFLYGCLHCKHGPTDKEMMPISNWAKLTYLVVCNVCTFRDCHFLPLLAVACPQLTALDFQEIGNPRVCHFIPNVISVLRRSKKLKFLRISQYGFQLDNSLFWKSVELCRSLEGMCLYSNIATPLATKTVTKTFAKLPFFHVFHLRIPRFCSNLYEEVRKVMYKNGVLINNIKTSRPSESFDCDVPHFPW